MTLVVTKLEVASLGQLQSLVMEHLDGIEAGLTVLDARLLLGRASVDIVALDAQGGLVLVTAGFTADEDMLLRAVEAYSWCLEYPDAIQRLYPSVEVSAARPPRLMFVIERLPDAFHRKIKQLGFSEVDCVEFRHLDVGGTPAAYFDTVARLRRGPGLAEFQPAPIARRVAEPPRRTPEPSAAERAADKLHAHNGNVVPLVSAPSNPRVTSVRLQKLPSSMSPGHGNAGAPVIDIGARTAVATSRVEVHAPHAEDAASAEAVRTETLAPRIEMPSAQIETPALDIALPVDEIVETTLEIATPVMEPPIAENADPVTETSSVEDVQVVAETPSVQDVEALAEAPSVQSVETVAEMPSIQDAELAAEAPIAEAVAQAPGVQHADPVAEAPSVEPAAPAVEEIAPHVETPVAETIAPVSLREAFAIPEPVVAAPVTPPTPEPRVSFAEIAKELLGGRAAASTILASAGAATETNHTVTIEDMPAAAPTKVVEEAHVEPSAEPLVAGPVIAKPVDDKPAVPPVTPKPVFTAPKPVATPSKLTAPAIKPVVSAPTSIAPASKPLAPAPTPAATTTAPKPAVAATPAGKPTTPDAAAQNVPQEFEGLKFPNDGVLTRQWMEFLNQMASSK